LLWRGDTADEAKKFRRRHKGALPDIEQAFLDEIIAYETAVARRKRVAIIGAFVGLGALVIAAMVALVVIQKSRTQAKQQALIAEAKSKEAEDNLAAMKRKEAERQKAESEKQKAEQKVQVQEVKLDAAQEDLAKKNQELEAALAEAQKNEAEAKRAELRARAAQESAERAQGEAVAAKDQVAIQKMQVELLLKQEQERVKRLQSQIGSPIVDDLK
jgi:septal ring factor EnvC (AmiA/AmiB activator)